MFLCPGQVSYYPPILLLSLLLRSSCRIVSCHLELIIYSSGQLAVLLNWWALWLARKGKWRYVGRGWGTDFNLRILFVISACLINVSLLWWCWSFACCVDLLVNATWTSVLAKEGGQGSSLRGYQVSSPTACAKLANDIVNMANIAGPGLDTPSPYPSPWRPANPQKNVQCRHHLQLLLIPFSLYLSLSLCVLSPFSLPLSLLAWRLCADTKHNADGQCSFKHAVFQWERRRCRVAQEQEVPGLTVCPGAPGACLAKVPQMRVTMMITLIHIHDYIYLYTVAIKNSRSASKCDEKQKQTNNNARRQRRWL